MQTSYKPDNENQLVELLQYALAENKTLAVYGRNSKAGFGYPVDADLQLSTAAMSGILDYEPAELVMRARAGTSLEEITQVLADNNQALAFEPGALGRLYDNKAGSASIAGVFMANLSGSRRFLAGAARDHLLGFRAVNGRGELYKSGGNVIKNVTGYDLSKLVCGSWGTLSVLSELSFKVLPAPVASLTAGIAGLSTATALRLLSDIAASPLQASGLAYLPSDCIQDQALADSSRGLCLLRFEGSQLALEACLKGLRDFVRHDYKLQVIDAEGSLRIWQELGEVSALQDAEVVLKISIPPALASQLAAQLEAIKGCQWFADAAASCFWLALPVVDACHQIQTLRRQLQQHGASVVLYKADDALKYEAGVFTPMSRALASLQQRVKSSFDPQQILNRGRLAFNS